MKTTKITLLLDRDVIRDAKAFAKARGKSLSSIVEQYLKMLTQQSPEEGHQLSPEVKALKGIVSSLGDVNYKDVVEEELRKKYGLK